MIDFTKKAAALISKMVADQGIAGEKQNVVCESVADSLRQFAAEVTRENAKLFLQGGLGQKDLEAQAQAYEKGSHD